MSDNSSIVSHPPKSSHSTSPSHSPVVRTIVRTLKKGFRRYHQLLVTSPKSLDFKPFRASILLDSRQKNYRLHMARHVHFDVRSTCLSSETCQRFCSFTIHAPSGSVRQWELVYSLLPTLLYASRVIPYRLPPDALLNIGNWSKELYRLTLALFKIQKRRNFPA